MNTKLTKKHSRQSGFTLIEIMITVAIIGILAAIAYPSYQDQVRKARRADAQGDLLELTSFMERFYSQNDRYDQNKTGDAVTLPFTQSPQEGNAYYQISFSAGPTRETYTLQAVPQGPQTNDRCDTLTVNNAGKTDAAEDNCWK